MLPRKVTKQEKEVASSRKGVYFHDSRYSPCARMMDDELAEEQQAEAAEKINA